MATPAYYYSSTAGSYTLTASVTTSSTIINLDGVVGLPGSVPFKVVIDPGQVSEEIVKVTAMAGASLTVTRAWDGSTASSHSAGAVVRHMMTAEDFTLSRAHEAASTSVHGVSGSVVGTGSTQSLINKDLSSPSNTFPNTLATLTGTQTLTNKTLDATNVFPRMLVNGDIGASVDLNTMTTPGDYVQRTSANATLALNYPEATAGHLTVDTSNNGGMVYHRYQTYGSSARVYVRGYYNGTWYSWSLLAFNSDLQSHISATSAHGTSGAVVGTTDTQTLTNKNLTSSTNSFPSSLATLTGTQTLTNKTMSGSSNTFSNIPQAAVTGLATIQTNVNKLMGFDRCYAYAATSTSLPSGATTAVALDGESWDTNGMHSTTTNNSRVTVQTAGQYLVIGQAAISGSSSTGIREVMVRQNGTIIAYQENMATSSGNTVMNACVEVTAAVGDYFELAVSQTSGSTLGTVSGSGTTFLSVRQYA